MKMANPFFGGGGTCTFDSIRTLSKSGRASNVIAQLGTHLLSFFEGEEKRLFFGGPKKPTRTRPLFLVIIRPEK